MGYVRDGDIQGCSLVFLKAHCSCISPSLTETIVKCSKSDNFHFNVLETHVNLYYQVLLRSNFTLDLNGSETFSHRLCQSYLWINLDWIQRWLDLNLSKLKCSLRNCFRTENLQQQTKNLVTLLKSSQGTYHITPNLSYFSIRTNSL